MIEMLKRMVTEKGMNLVQSPIVSKILASETAGAVIEKAMTVPFKVSSAMTTQKERLVQMFDLATQEDMDELRRTITRMEATIKTGRNETGSTTEG